jgi:hypothetical protein
VQTPAVGFTGSSVPTQVPTQIRMVPGAGQGGQQPGGLPPVTLPPGATENQVAGVRIQAVQFARDMVLANKILPSEQDGLVALFVQAWSDDQRSGQPVNFSGSLATRVDALKQAYAQRQAHGLTKEQLQQATQAQALFNRQLTPGSEPGTVAPDRRKELLSRSSIGRSVLDHEARNGAARN